MSRTLTRLIKLRRTLQEGLRNFYRDGWLSFATVSVLTLSLYIIAATFLLVAIGGALMNTIQRNVSVSAYFYPTVTESRITDIKTALEQVREVESVTYVSREQALKDFKATTKDPVILNELNEFEKEGDNPLFASLVIKTVDPRYYKDIAKLLTLRYKDDISDVNFSKNRDIIERLAHVIAITRTVGITLGAIFVVIAVLMVYNTVRITMFARRKEFEVMRLVGASNLYVRMPSLFEGVFYGVTAAVVTVILLTLTAYFLTPVARDIIFGDTTLFGFYMQYFREIAVGTLVIGVTLGMLSGMIAIRRYLKV